MKTVTFTYPHHTGGYGCSEPNDQSGEYVRADVARELLAACKSARAFIESLRVPQDIASAAEQVRQGMHRLDALAVVIAKAEEGGEPC
jgi:hypothetical protein